MYLTLTAFNVSNLPLCLHNVETYFHDSIMIFYNFVTFLDTPFCFYVDFHRFRRIITHRRYSGLYMHIDLDGLDLLGIVGLIFVKISSFLLDNCKKFTSIRNYSNQRQLMGTSVGYKARTATEPLSYGYVLYYL